MGERAPKVGRPRDPSRDAAILEATLDLLGDLGYEEVTVRAIAQRAGVGLATMYRRWPTKDQLIVDAIGAFDPTTRMRPDADPVENLVGLVAGIVELFQGPRRRVIANVVGQLASNPALADALRAKVLRPRLAAVAHELRRLRGVDPARAEQAAVHIPATVLFRIQILGERISKQDVRILVMEATTLAGARLA